MLSVGAFVTRDIDQISVSADPAVTHDYRIDQNGTVPVLRSHMAHFVVDADIDVGSELAQNYAFGIPYLDVPSEVQPHDQLRAEVTNTNYNNPRIFLHVFIHLHSYYLVILRLLLSVFGLANRA